MSYMLQSSMLRQEPLVIVSSPSRCVWLGAVGAHYHRVSYTGRWASNGVVARLLPLAVQ